MPGVAMHRHRDTRPDELVHAREVVARRVPRDMHPGMILDGEDLDAARRQLVLHPRDGALVARDLTRSEEHTSELQSLMRISYAVFCLKKKKKTLHNTIQQHTHETK